MASERELTNAIYGTVVGAAAMAAASVRGTLIEVVVTVLVTVAVYWAAERYAELLAAAVHGPDRRSQVAQALRRGWPTDAAAAGAAPCRRTLCTSAPEAAFHGRIWVPKLTAFSLRAGPPICSVEVCVSVA